MKKLLQILLLSIAIPVLTGCGGDLSPLEDGHHRAKKEKAQPMMKTVRMSFGGDFVTESDEPMQRAKDGETYVGINVFYKDKEKLKEEKYAYGVFKKKDGISINLLTGYLYRFEATILIEGDDIMCDNGSDRVGAPFRYKDKNSTLSSYFDKDDMRDFVYTYNKSIDDKRESLIELHSGTAYVKTGKTLDDELGDFHYPRVKRFYGTSRDFDPSGLSEVEIPMAYKSFGLKFILETVPENTSLTMEDISNRDVSNLDEETRPALFFPENLSLNANSDDAKTWESIYSLNNLYADSEDFELKFTWTQANGENKTFKHSFKVDAKKKKILKINITGDVSQTKSGNIIFTQMDDEELVLEEDPEVLDKIFYKKVMNTLNHKSD